MGVGKKQSTYHTGWYQVGDTAVFQVRRSIDNLDPEIIEYLGERETTKAAARRKLRDEQASVLAGLQKRYPHRGIRNVTIE